VPHPTVTSVGGRQGIEQSLLKARVRRRLPAPPARRLLRERNGLSQDDIARAVGVTRTAVERASAVDARNEMAVDDADRRLTLAQREAEALARGAERLTLALQEARAKEALARKHDIVAHARREAARGAEIIKRLEALASEYRQLDRELQAITIVVSESNSVARELGEPKIILPKPSGTFVLWRDPKDETAVRARAKELRAAAIAA
jgi:hypothetical protein